MGEESNQTLVPAQAQVKENTQSQPQPRGETTRAKDKDDPESIKAILKERINMKKPQGKVKDKKKLKSDLDDEEEFVRKGVACACCYDDKVQFQSTYDEGKGDPNMSTYFEPQKFRVRTNPLKKEKITRNPHFRPNRSEVQYYQIADLKDRKLSIDVSLGSGLGVRFRIAGKGKQSTNYICKNISKKLYGNKRKANLIRNSIVEFVLSRWKMYIPGIQGSYKGQIAFFRTFDPVNDSPARHDDAKWIYEALHNDRLTDIKIIEISALCELVGINLTLIVNALDGDYQVFAPLTKFEDHIYILAKEVRDYELKDMVSHELYWLNFIEGPTTKEEDKFLPNCTLYLTYGNPPINYFHLLDYDNYLRQAAKETVKDCKNTRKFKRLPKLIYPIGKPEINPESGQLKRNTGHIWFSRTKKVYVYWRPQRKGTLIRIRNAFRGLGRCIFKCLTCCCNIKDERARRIRSHSKLLSEEQELGMLDMRDKERLRQMRPRDSIVLDSVKSHHTMIVQRPEPVAAAKANQSKGTVKPSSVKK